MLAFSWKGSPFYLFSNIWKIFHLFLLFQRVCLMVQPLCWTDTYINRIYKSEQRRLFFAESNVKHAHQKRWQTREAQIDLNFAHKTMLTFIRWFGRLKCESIFRDEIPAAKWTISHGTRLCMGIQLHCAPMNGARIINLFRNRPRYMIEFFVGNFFCCCRPSHKFQSTWMAIQPSCRPNSDYQVKKLRLRLFFASKCWRSI